MIIKGLKMKIVQVLESQRQENVLKITQVCVWGKNLDIDNDFMAYVIFSFFPGGVCVGT